MFYSLITSIYTFLINVAQMGNKTKFIFFLLHPNDAGKLRAGSEAVRPADFTRGLCAGLGPAA